MRQCLSCKKELSYGRANHQYCANCAFERSRSIEKKRLVAISQNNKSKDKRTYMHKNCGKVLTKSKIGEKIILCCMDCEKCWELDSNHSERIKGELFKKLLKEGIISCQ